MKRVRFYISSSQYKFLSDVETAPLQIFKDNWSDFLSSIPDFKGHVVRTDLGVKDGVNFFIESYVPREDMEVGKNHLIIEYPDGSVSTILLKIDDCIGRHKAITCKKLLIMICLEKSSIIHRILKFLKGE